MPDDGFGAANMTHALIVELESSIVTTAVKRNRRVDKSCTLRNEAATPYMSRRSIHHKLVQDCLQSRTPRPKRIHERQCLIVQPTQEVFGVIKTFGDVFHVEHSVCFHGVVLRTALENVDDLAIAAITVSNGMDNGK